MTNTHPRRVLSGTISKMVWVLVGSMVSRLSSGLSTIIMLYFLTAAQYGELTTVLFWSLLISLIPGAGLSDFIVKLRFETGTGIRGPVLHAWLVAVGVGAVTAVLIYIVLIGGLFSEDGTTLFILCSLASILSAMVLIAQAALRADGRVVEMAQLMAITALVTSGGLVFFAWSSADIVILGQWYLASFVLIFLLHVFVLGRFGLLRTAPIHWQTLRSFFMRSYSFSLVHLLMLSLPIVSGTLVLYFSGETTAGSYNLVMALFLAAGNLATVLDQLFYPQLIASRKGRKDRIASYIILSLFFSLPAIVFFSVLGEDLTAAIFPPKYAYVAELISVLGLLIPLRFSGSCLVVILRIKGLQRVSVAAYAVGILSLLCIAFALAYWRGIAPAPYQIAWALFAAEVLAVLLMLCFAHQDIRFKRIWLRMSQLLLITCLSSAVALWASGFSGNLVLNLSLAAITYCGVAVISGLVQAAMTGLRAGQTSPPRSRT